MALLLLHGPHAVGKTAALDRLMESALGLPVILVKADNSNTEYHLETGNVVKVKPPGRNKWKGAKADKIEVIDEAVADDENIWVVDSVRPVLSWVAEPFNTYGGGIACVFTLLDGPTLGRFMRERCAEVGKDYNEGYWDAAKLDYESHRRYVNAAAKYCEPMDIPYWVEWVSYDRHEWDEIDNLLYTIVSCVKPRDWYV